MSLFDWLLVAHLVGDFLVQTRNMAMRKAHDWPWMFRHVAAYMVTVTIVVVGYTIAYHPPAWLAIVSLLFLAGTHIVLDRRKFTNWWARNILQASEHPWIPIVADQVFHIVTLAIVAQVLVLTSK